LDLHGALHLETDLFGRSRKRQWQPGANLLESFQNQDPTGGWFPLFVSEGLSRDKMRAIARSDYLSFAYQAFVVHRGPLVVFGHSLGVQDQHLANALKAERRRVAVSVLPGDD
jgi:hypothetical protein